MNGVFDLDFPQSSINPAGAPGLDKFLEAYKSTYKSDPQSGHSLTNYVGAKAFFDAIAKAKSTDKDKIRASVLAYKVPAGQTANGWAFDFGEDGQNNASTFYVMQWQDGKLVTIAPSNLAPRQAGIQQVNAEPASGARTARGASRRPPDTRGPAVDRPGPCID